jgi:hypothetical protein
MYRFRRGGLFAALLVLIVTLQPAASAGAQPRTPAFGPVIDAHAEYQGQNRCDPHAKPGVLAFRRLVLEAYPATGGGIIERSCSLGGQSEHKDGRAWDWIVSASDDKDRARAEELMDWLLATDRYGNRHAMARRVGLMYMIWNHRWWNAWTRKWQRYGGASPHTDHVHFSFSWAGARKKVTFWNRLRSTANGLDAHPAGSGYWIAAGNGRVKTKGEASSFGSVRGWHPSPIVEVVHSGGGGGYWLVRRNGKIHDRGGSRAFERRLPGSAVVDAEAHAGGGLWLATSAGRVLRYGRADHLGDLSDEDLTVAAMASTATGDGYLLVSRRGVVSAFGDARHRGDLEPGSGVVADIELMPAGTGYWIVTTTGRVFPFGAARRLGEVVAKIRPDVVEIQSSASGRGYWLLDEFGHVRRYGDAPALGSY